jgi:hypothetical protein
MTTLFYSLFYKNMVYHEIHLMLLVLTFLSLFRCHYILTSYQNLPQQINY